MQTAWYGVKVWKLVSPNGSVTNYGTKLTHQITYEMWDVINDAGVKVGTAPQNVKGKYGVSMSMAYNTDPKVTPPSVALVRVEFPDGETSPIDPADCLIVLDTQAKWNSAMNSYPTLKNRFLDQPYYPAV